MFKRVGFFFLWVLAFSLAAPVAGVAVIVENANITQHTTWTADDVHRVTANISVSDGIILTIAPGAIVKFDSGKGLTVNQGVLNAVGESGNPIIFTSWPDDSAGGDTNGDGPSSGKPGDWARIYLNQTLSSSRLEHCEVRYAGSSNEGSVYLYRASVPIVACDIRNGSSFGLLVSESSPLIENNTITANADHGVKINYGSPTLRGNTVSGNNCGIYSQYARPVIENNTVTGNRDWGVYFVDDPNIGPIAGNTVTGNKRAAILPATAVPGDAEANVLSPNTINGLWIRGIARATDLHLKVLYPGEAREVNTYQIYNTLTMSANTGLTVDPGVVVKFYDGSAGLTIHGWIDAAGTAEKPVVFTSTHDDSAGGDFNANGYATVPANGNWRGIYVSDAADASKCRLDHVNVRYAGASDDAALYIYKKGFTLSNCEFSNSSKCGIRAHTATITVENCRFFANIWDGIKLQYGNATVTGSRFYANFGDGIRAENGSVATVAGCEVFGNTGYGVNNISTGAVVTDTTWWGAADGPGSPGGTGTGDQVSASVTVSGFAVDGTEYHYFDAGGTAHCGYGIGAPMVNGTGSTEWGSDPARSFLYALRGTPVTAEYIGLPPSAAYTLLVTYLNQDSDGSIQDLTDINGETIHPAMGLPSSGPLTYAFTLPSASVSTGTLRLNFNAISGMRAVVGGIFLLKEASADSAAPEIHLLSPASGAILQRTTVTLSGTASDAAGGISRVEVGIGKEGETPQWFPVSSLNGAGQWEYRWSPLTDGRYSLTVRCRDNAGNLGTAAEAPVVTVDGQAPAPVGNLFVQGVSGTAGAMRLTWSLSADDGTGAADVSRYDVYRGENGLGPFAQVARLNPGTVACDDAGVAAGSDYYYYIRTVDRAGNGSDSILYGPVQSTGAADTVAPEDVTSLTATASQVSGASVSVYLAWTPSVNSAGDMVDQLLYVSKNGETFGNNAPAYDNGQAYRLGRAARSYQESGLTAGQPYTFRVTVIDAVPNESAGAVATVTPTGAASEVVRLGGSLSADTRLAAGIYYITDNFSIPAGRMLTFGPGAILKFGGGKALNVYGTLIAEGTVSDPVVFTAWTDDEFGGDSNGNGPSTGTPGYWNRINIDNSSTSRLTRVVVRYGGYGNGESVYLYRSAAPVMNSEIAFGAASGIHVRECAPIIEGNTVTDNAGNGIHIYDGGGTVVRGNNVSGSVRGIYSQYSTPVIDGNTITGCSDYGVWFEDATSTPPLTGNTIIGNTRPLIVPASALPDGTNILTPNTQRVIRLRGNTLRGDQRLKIWEKGTPDEIATYVVYTSNIVVPAYTFLTIDPGVIVKFAANVEIIVNGALTAGGTADEKIVFTAFADDTFGGDTNANAGATLPANGNWKGITFNDSFFEAESILNHVKVRYAGDNGSGGVYLYRADIRVENSEISNSSSNGIRVYECSPHLIGNRIWGNFGDGIRLEQYANAEITFNEICTNLSDGVEVLSYSRATATNNRIFTNRGFGINNGTANVIDAAQSWWGDADGSGPYHSTANTAGTGNKVNNNVTFSPWQTTVATAYAYRNFSASAGMTAGNLPAPVLVQGTLSDEWDTTSKRADRTMAWDALAVILDYSGLDPLRHYKIRVSYFNGDPAGSLQSLADGAGNPIHGSMAMPAASPIQYEFSIPTPYYSDGNLRLVFNHDNPDTTLKAAVPEIWLMEDIPEITPPRFTGIDYNDADGSGTLSPGDAYHFHFSEEMDTTLLTDGTTDANDRLSPGGLGYGAVNAIRWTADRMTAIVTLTEGFTVTGTETVTPSDLTDLFGNLCAGTQNLGTIDGVCPVFTGIDWIDADGSGMLSLGDHYLFRFDERMNASVLRDGTTDANAHLRPEGGMRYGSVNTVSWNADETAVTITVTDGFSIMGDELVRPGSFITDMAGNPATGAHRLSGRDTVPPRIVSVRFDDADGNGAVSIGDGYLFGFDEAMDASSLSDNSTEANQNLSPAGKVYGTTNRIAWNTGRTECIIRITAGFTITGMETVTPSPLVADKAGNPVSNTIALTLADTMAPEIAGITANYASPVRAVTNYRLTVRFTTAMDPAVFPVLALTGTGEIQPVAPAGGTWLSTVYPNDTFVTPDILLSAGMDGEIRVDISGGKDKAGNLMVSREQAFAFTLGATAPPLPAAGLASTTCDAARVTWSGYSAPADLSGFQVFRTREAPFTSIDGLSPVAWLNGSAREYTASGLLPDIPDYLAVVAVDAVGNKSASVTPVEIRIDRPIPPPVGFTIGQGIEPDDAVVSWSGYDAGSLCGFAGFNVYVQPSPFVSVSSLAPYANLDPDEFEFYLAGLDRSKTYYIAVVGENTAGEFNPDVTPATWTDPYAGQIDRDLTLGGGTVKTIEIAGTMVVTSGATLTIESGTTLYFAPGAGIDVQSGRLVINGTALDPVVLSSVNDREGSTPSAGDWNGIRLGPGTDASVLRHAIVRYGRGLTLDGVSPAVEAFTAEQNAPDGLCLINGAVLDTADALLQYNGTALKLGGASRLTLSHSVIHFSTTAAADVDVAATLTASGNWRGSGDLAVITGQINGTAVIEPVLETVPLLTPAIGTVDGITRVGTRNVNLRFACRTAREMRISEDSFFQGVYFDSFAPAAPFTLSSGGGEKTVHVQFRSSTNAVSDPIGLILTYITEGPVIGAFSLFEGQTIARPLTVTGSATAQLGMQAIGFHLDGTRIASSPTGSLAFAWDVRDVANGIHRVKLEATDLAGNTAVSERSVLLAVTAPPAPVITVPAGNLTVAIGEIAVRGTAEPGVLVQVSSSGSVKGSVNAGADGTFEFPSISLAEGENIITAAAQDRIGNSANSNRVTIIFDSGPPAAPVLLEPTVIPKTGIALSWQYAQQGERPSRFRVYRHDRPFSLVSGAALVGDNLAVLNFTDTTVRDGNYYYGIIGLDGAGNVSALSNTVSAAYDATAPVFAIAYGKVPPFGPGTVAFTLSTNEKLYQAPTLTITPAGTGALNPALAKVDEFTYSGSFTISEATLSGNARVSVSGRDMVGNTFSGLLPGGDFMIDTRGPGAVITVDKAAPVQVLTTVNLGVAVALSEAPAAGLDPLLRFTPPQGIQAIVPLTGSGTAWSGTLPLKPEMGNGIGSFTLEVQDPYGNPGAVTQGGSLEIYNTELPTPPAVPSGLNAVSQPGGKVILTWSAAENAEVYRLYRSTGNCDVPAYETVAEIAAPIVTLSDTPPSDGAYCYAVSALRRGAESATSEGVPATADATPPGAPVNVAVALGQEGIMISWAAPEGEIPARYTIKRNGTLIKTVTGALSAIDHPSVGGNYQYVVAAADAIGNERAADPVGFDMTVGAVSSLEVMVLNGEVPRLFWENSDPAVTGYNIYKGGAKLNAAPLTAMYFTDNYYTGSSRVRYEVRSVNAAGQESPARSIDVYPVVLNAISNPDADGNSRPLTANYFDTFRISVANRDTAAAFPMGRLQLEMMAGSVRLHSLDQPVNRSIEAAIPYTQEVVIPCGVSLDAHNLSLTVVQGDSAGGTVTYLRDIVFSNISRTGVRVELSTADLPLAGGYADITVCVRNISYTAMDVVLSRGNGQLPGDIFVAITNEDGLEIGRAEYRGSAPGAILAPDGTTYVTLAPQGQVCVTVKILVPEALPEGAVITFEGGASGIYNRILAPDAKSSGKLTGTLESGITRSEYYGTAGIGKTAYTNSEPVIISGRAIDRATGEPRANVPLKIGFSTRGFKWFADTQPDAFGNPVRITTDASGNYSYSFKPSSGSSGQFIVWAAHPDVHDVIRQAGFDYYRLYCNPVGGSLRMSKADTTGFTVTLYNPGEKTLDGFASSFRAYTIDAGDNEIPDSTMTGAALFGDGFSLAPGEKRPIRLELGAAMDAPDTVNVKYTFTSAQGATAEFTGTVSLLPAVPLITVDAPAVGYVDVSLDRGNMLTQSITVTNKGLKDFLGVELVLPAAVTWMSTNLASNPDGKVILGDIAVGQSRTFDVVFAPPADAAFGYHQDKIVLKGTNSPQTFDVRLYAMITSNITGAVDFHVVNILGQIVPDAQVRMRNAAIRKDVGPLKTNVDGDVTFSGLQEGDWSWQVSASGHSSVSGVVTVVADQAIPIEPMLSKSLVTINFRVEPVPYTDRYEIKLEQTFETHVPAPVLVVDPPHIDFYNVEPGFTVGFTARAKNHGLIKIHDIVIEPGISRYGILEPLITYIPELGAMEEIEIPYRLVYSGQTADGAVSGGMSAFGYEPMFDKDDFADCATGGFAEMAKGLAGLVGLHSKLAGKSECYKGYELKAVAGVIAAMHVLGAPLSPLNFVGNLLSCLSQQFFTFDLGGSGYGSSGTQKAGPTTPARNLTSDHPCFAAGTPILMADGSTKPIEDVRAGDRVMASNGKVDTVKFAYVRDTDHIREIWYRSADGARTFRLETTDDHLFWIDGKDWKPAREITPGGCLMTPEQERLDIYRNERFDRKVKVYNLDVEQYGAYFANGVLAHERCGNTSGER